MAELASSHTPLARSGFWRNVSSSPHYVLAAAAALILATEWTRGSATGETGVVWPLIEAGLATVSLTVAYRQRGRLSLFPVIGLGLVFQLCWITIHLLLGVHGDPDPVVLYPHEGHALLSGHYPNSPYPPGAVVLFALETWIGGGAARTSNAFLMIPFQLVCVGSIWMLRTRWSAWLATVVALWPINAFFWEFRFDLVPTAALVVGLLLAYREHWLGAGFVLGLGAVVKWTPALSALALLVWLVWRGRKRLAGALALGFAIPALAANIPLLIADRSALFWTYQAQDKRKISGESLPYLILRTFHRATPGRNFWGDAHVSASMNHAIPKIQESSCFSPSS